MNPKPLNDKKPLDDNQPLFDPEDTPSLMELGRITRQGLTDLQNFMRTVDARNPDIDAINQFIDSIMERAYQSLPVDLRYRDPDIADDLDKGLSVFRHVLVNAAADTLDIQTRH